MKFLVYSALLLISAVASAQTAVAGTWLNAEKDGKIEIYACGNRICGKITWIKDATDDKGKPRIDAKNPEVSLQNRPIQGLVIMQGFEYQGNNVWENGKIYDPKSGKTYSCKLTLKNPKTLDVRGFIGISLLGRTDTWTRAQ